MIFWQNGDLKKLFLKHEIFFLDWWGSKSADGS
jgi:hypothetical protein